MAWEAAEGKGLAKEDVEPGKGPSEAERGLQQDAANQPIPLLVASDSPVAGEAEAGKEDILITFPRRKKLSLPTVSLSAALLLLLVASGWMLYTKMVARPKPGLPPLDVVLKPPGTWEKQIKEAEEKMFESRDKFDVAWNAASNKAKMVFATYYMPSTERARVAVSQALSYYKLQVLEMSELSPPDSNEERLLKQQYELAMQLVTCLVDAATARLNGLIGLEQNGDLPALIFDRETGRQTLRPYEMETPMPFGEFVEVLKERNIAYSPVAVVKDDGVGRAKVKELVDLMEMEANMVALDKKVQLEFEPLLKMLKLSLATMRRETLVRRDEAFASPRDGAPFDLDLFLAYLLERHLSTEAESYRTELLDYLASNFSNENADKAIKAFKETHRKRLDGLVQEKQLTVEKSSLEARKLHQAFPLSVFVL